MSTTSDRLWSVHDVADYLGIPHKPRTRRHRRRQGLPQRLLEHAGSSRPPRRHLDQPRSRHRPPTRRPPHRQSRSLTPSECRRWIGQLGADPAAVRRDLADLTRWLLATGVRIGEAIVVDWSSIDMDRATVEIDYKVLRVKGAGLQRIRRTKSDATPSAAPWDSAATRGGHVRRLVWTARLRQDLTRRG